MMGLELPVSSDSNRYEYSSTDDACVRPYCSHRLWSEVCSNHRRYTQDLPHIQYRYITPFNNNLNIYLPLLFITFRY
jgi:hypothetical protein